MKQMHPSSPQKTVRQINLKSPQFLVKQLQVYARGQIMRLIAIIKMVSMHRTGDRYFIGQQSLKMNHYDPILTDSTVMKRIKPTQRQTFVVTAFPPYYQHPQKFVMHPSIFIFNLDINISNQKPLLHYAMQVISSFSGKGNFNILYQVTFLEIWLWHIYDCQNRLLTYLQIELFGIIEDSINTLILSTVSNQNKKMKTQFPQECSQVQVGDYTVCYNQLLGKGSTGTVYKGYQIHTQSPIAVKVIELSSIRDDATRSLLENQKIALQTIKDPNVVKLLQIIQQDGKCFIITQLCEGQTLAQMISQRGNFTEEEAMRIFRKVLSGCLAITQNCIIHRDLKPANIIVSPTLEPKIIDFGFCQVIQSKKVMRTFNVGSPSYMAPQAYLRTLYSEKSDSWSLGMILFQMLHGRTLDEGLKINDYFESLKNIPNYIAKFTGNWNNNVKQVLQKSLKYQTEERMSISGMKYLADVYYLKNNRSDKTSTHSETLASNFKTYQPHQSKLPQTSHTLRNISQQTINCPPQRQGLISYTNFSKSKNDFSRGSKISQVSMSNSSQKSISIRLIRDHPNENIQPQPSKMPSMNLNDFYQSCSSKNMIERKIRGPPVFRQVTVRYL